MQIWKTFGNVLATTINKLIITVFYSVEHAPT